MSLARLALSLLAAGVLAGCGTLGQVAAWEKGDLAKPAMQFENDPLGARFNQHVYFSKEAASGGFGVGGGGCGCN